MPHRSITLALALSLALLGTAYAAQGDIDQVNGSIQIAGGQRAGDVSTVNGTIRLAVGASAGKVRTVNGSIDASDRVSAHSLGTVNGAIDIGPGGRVNGNVGTVNGRIDIGRGGEIDGRVSNVNGRIHLAATRVTGDVQTVAGDIEIDGGSAIDGGIRVGRCNTGWIHWFDHCRTPRVVIGPGAVVQGTLDFHRPVELYVSDRARIGPVKGATPHYFSGDRP